MPRGHPRSPSFKLLLAGLISHRAARLASGLAGRLALAAAALVHRALERRLVDRLDMLHRISSSVSIYAYFTFFFIRMQGTSGRLLFLSARKFDLLRRENQKDGKI